MYHLVSLADVVQIHPSEFNKPGDQAIEDFINAKYADKVVHRVGLCVAFHSIISSSDGLIGYGTGLVNVNVDFQMIVFRPVKGEIVQATITDSNPRSGIYLSHDFFEDVVVPPETLFEDTSWGSDDQGVEAFIWRSKVEETGLESEYFFDRLEPCLYRAEEEKWRDLSPQMQSQGQNFLADDSIDDNGLRKTPYLIRGSMMMSGLGPTLWWTGEMVGEDEINGVNGAVGVSSDNVVLHS